MGIAVDASSNTFVSLSRIEKQEDWAEMKQIPILSNSISIMHIGRSKSIAINAAGPVINWSAKFLGDHEFLYVNGEKTETKQLKSTEKLVSYCQVLLAEGDKTTVSITP